MQFVFFLFFFFFLLYGNSKVSNVRYEKFNKLNLCSLDELSLLSNILSESNELCICCAMIKPAASDVHMSVSSGHELYTAV